MSVYPTTIPSLTQVFEATDDVDWMNASRWHNLRDELRAALIELGTLPKGTFGDVKARLDDIYPQFHDRGDPVTWDWQVGDLTTDGAWHDLDLSTIVPAGTKAVLMRANIVDNLVNQLLYFREKGNSGWQNSSLLTTQVANQGINHDVVVAVDANRVIQYWASSTTWTTINIAVRGYWK